MLWLSIAPDIHPDEERPSRFKNLKGLDSLDSQTPERVRPRLNLASDK